MMSADSHTALDGAMRPVGQAGQAPARIRLQDFKTTVGPADLVPRRLLANELFGNLLHDLILPACRPGNGSIALVSFGEGDTHEGIADKEFPIELTPVAFFDVQDLTIAPVGDDVDPVAFGSGGRGAPEAPFPEDLCRNPRTIITATRRNTSNRLRTTSLTKNNISDDMISPCVCILLAVLVWSQTDQPGLLSVEIDALNLPARICPCSLVDMVALCLMIPPLLISISRWRQFGIDYSFNLFETKGNLPLTFREIAQIDFKRSVFAGHNHSFPYNVPWHWAAHFKKQYRMIAQDRSVED